MKGLRIIRIFLFLAFSFLDLRIEAKEIITLPLSKEVTTLPEKCLTTSEPCTVLTPKRKKFELLVGKSKITMDEKSEVLRSGPASLALVKGIIWVRVDSPINIKTEYGTVDTQAGEFWVEHKDDKVMFYSIYGELKLTPKGSKENLTLYPGFNNWLGPASSDGMATSGVPMLLSIEDHVRRWARLYPGKKSDFKKAVHDYFNEWQSHIEEASQKQEALALRYIADENERQKREEIRLKSIRRENEHVRDMMKKRLLME